MLYKLTTEIDYLKADLFHRETTVETREFFDLVASSAVGHRRSRILISVHASNAVFAVDKSGFLTRFRNISSDPAHRIALVADSAELGFSHQYLETLGRQHGINVRNFRDEPAAVQWLRENR